MLTTHAIRLSTTTATVALLALTGLAGLSEAQAAASGAQASQTAQAPGGPAAPALYSFAIAAKPLAQALDDFGRVTGLSIVYTASEPHALTAPPVAGRMAADEALARLLAGSGLSWRYSGPSTVTILAADTDGALLLDPVSVEGAAARAETATGPVPGYIARRATGGTKTDAPLISTPASISVVTRDQMEAQGVQRVEQALRYTAGASVEIFGPENRGDTIYLRGFENETHLNGLLLQGGAGYSGWTMEPYGLERVEVERGPASVLYGKAAPGGVINQVSKRPTAEPLREVVGGVGSFERFQGAFDLSGPLGEDSTVLYRLTGLARDSGTQVDHADERRLFLAPALTVTPREDTTVTLLAQIQHNDSGNTIGFLPADGTLLSNPNGRIPTSFFAGEPDFDRYDTRQYMVGYEAEHVVNDSLTLRQNARWARLDLDYRTLYGAGLLADRRTLARAALVNEDSTDAVMADTQAVITGRHDIFAHQILAGLDHQSSWADARTGFGAAPGIDVFNPVYGRPVAMPAWGSDSRRFLHQTGLYLQDTVTIAEVWTLLLGGRHDWARSENEERLTGATATKDDSAFSGRVGLAYQFPIGLAPYASYAESFEPTTVTGANGRVLDPQTAHQYEAGVKYQPPGLDSFITAAVFDLRRENVITYDAVTWAATQTGETRSRGIELEGKLTLFDGLNLIAAYTYQDVEIVKTTAGNAGKQRHAIPARLASLWADYTLPSGPLQGLSLGGGVRYIGSSYGDAMNTFSVDAVTLFDAELGYEAGDYRFALNASNLFDKEYVASCWGSCYYGARQTILASVRYRW